VEAQDLYEGTVQKHTRTFLTPVHIHLSKKSGLDCGDKFYRLFQQREEEKAENARA